VGCYDSTNFSGYLGSSKFIDAAIVRVQAHLSPHRRNVPRFFERMEIGERPVCLQFFRPGFFVFQFFCPPVF